MNTQHGLSLIQLMMTLVVATTLVALSVPGLLGVTEQNRLVTTVNSLFAVMNLSRSEAVKRSLNVTACISQDQKSCSGTSWNQGWLVWVDLNRNARLDQAEEVIQVGATLPTATHVDSVQSQVVFNATGSVSRANSWTVCDHSHEGYEIRLLASGAMADPVRVECS